MAIDKIIKKNKIGFVSGLILAGFCVFLLSQIRGGADALCYYDTNITIAYECKKINVTTFDQDNFDVVLSGIEGYIDGLGEVYDSIPDMQVIRVRLYEDDNIIDVRDELGAMDGVDGARFSVPSMPN